jgi:hypothetical protein
MKRIYHQYKNWECYKYGMFKSTNNMSAPEWHELEDLAIKLLTNEVEFLNAGMRLIKEWKVSCEENLTNINQNRIAYIGQACCCLIHGVPEAITKQAWKQIPIEKQVKANKVAEKIIKIYESQNREIHSGMGNQMLLQWNS